MQSFQTPAAWSRPPIKDAVATAMGWRHPKTGELLVSVKGLLNDTAKLDAPSPLADPLPSNETTSPSDAMVDDGATADGEKIFSIVAGETTSVIELLAPNNHAYTKWEVDGTPVVKRGNTCEVPNGSTFVARNAKGEYTGNA